MTKLTPFITAYIECALWAEEGQLKEQGADDVSFNLIHPDSLALMILDCEKFQKLNEELLDSIGASDEQNGHDFWLTRNHHGAGFWDRGYGESGEKLTKAAQKFKECSLFFQNNQIFMEA